MDTTRTAGTHDVDVVRIAGGGEGVAHLEDGRVVFVAGAVPGDRARIELTVDKKRFAKGRVLDVIAAGPARIEPTCAHVADGCGGCDWRHIRPDEQLPLKAAIVTDALERIGRLTDPTVLMGAALPPAGGRTAVRAIVDHGRAGFRRRASHDAVLVDSCDVAHPLIEELLVGGRFGSASEVTLRVAVSTGERLALVAPTAADVAVPDDVIVVGADELDAGRAAFITEEVGGRRWQISAGSFFQTRPDGAAALVELVRSAVERRTSADGVVIDLYSGVGLFAGAATGGRRTTAVEANPSSAADARVNLADDPVTMIESTVEAWTPHDADVVIADPSRAGLGADAVDIVATTGAATVVLISCDPGSLGRDASLLSAAGYQLNTANVVDLFPQTSHVEVVSLFER